MRQERWTVYEEVEAEQWEEVSWHYRDDIARTRAQALAENTGHAVRVDWNLIEVTRNGVKCVDSDPDRWTYGPLRKR